MTSASSPRGNWYRHPKAIPMALLAMLLLASMLTAGMVRSLTLESMRRIEAQQSQIVLDSAQELDYDLSAYIAVVHGISREDRFLAQVANPTDKNLDEIAYSFEQVANRLENFDKIRWLDDKGKEQVRVERQPDGQIARIPQDQLQNKADRPYFKDNVSLPPGHASVSELDLSIENNQLIRPLRKVWRVTMPLRSHAGDSLGILLINLDTKDILKQLASAHDVQSAVAVLNTRGEWIHNLDEPEQEFGLQLGTGVTFASRHPAVWKTIQQSPTGVARDDAQAWLWHTYDPSKTTYQGLKISGPPLVMLSAIDNGRFWTIARNNTLVVAPIMLLVFAALAWVMHHLLKNMNALDQERQRASSIINGTQTGTWELNLQTDVALLNDHYAHMLGYTQAAINPSSLAMMKSILHPQDVTVLDTELQRHLADPQTAFNARYRLRHKNGHWVWIQSRGQIIKFTAEGKPSLMHGIHTDISDLVDATQKAEAANQAKSQFLASMSHELRTPMNAILGFTQVLERDSLTQDQMECLQEVSKAGKHLLALIDEVLDLSKIESGNLQLSIESLDAGELVEECLSLMKPQAKSRQIELASHVPQGLWVLADRMRLRQVLLNLLSNAVKYNRTQGKVSLTLSLTLSATGQAQTRFEVSDTGQGIPLEAQALVFQPFQRGMAEGSEIAGTGIGLSISRHLVQMMGGEIGFESSLGQGSTFWLALPVAPGVALSAAPVTQPIADLSPSKFQAPVKTVLCVDDNPANLRLAIKILKARPHIQVLSANAPELAIELASAHCPDLVLLDINMPRMDGYAVLRVLRQMPALDKTPVVAVTANAMPKDIARGKAAGFADYLTKPLGYDSFLATVDGLLDNAG
jgi:PAS domain S-box-containing protein